MNRKQESYLAGAKNRRQKACLKWIEKLNRILANNGQLTLSDYKSTCGRSFAKAKLVFDEFGYEIPSEPIRKYNTTDKATDAILKKHSPTFREWAGELWAIAEKRQITAADYQKICNRPYAAAKKILDRHNIQYPFPEGSRGSYAEIRETQYQAIMSLHNELGRPLTKKDVFDKLGCDTMETAKRRLESLHKFNFALPPISDWEPKLNLIISIDDEERKIEQLRAKSTNLKRGLVVVSGISSRPLSNGWYQFI